MPFARPAPLPRTLLSLATVALGFAVFDGRAAQVSAQTKPSTAAAAKKPDSKAAEKAYAAGVKAFDSGKVDSAVTSLSSALRQGGLPPQKMAKALFYRGSAYRKKGKPAQAISDLTSAVWIKGGLTDGDRVAAIEQRKAAYKEAGLGTKVPKSLQPGASVPSTAVATAVPVAPTASQVTSTPSGAATSAWQTTAGVAPASAAQQVASATPAAPATNTTASPFSALTPPITPTAPPPSTTLSAMPRGGSAPAPQAQTQTGSTGAGSTLSNIGSSISQGLSGVGSFFGNVFSSNNNAPANSANPTTEIATSSTQLPPATPGSPSTSAPTGGAVVTQGWGPSTKATTTSAPVRTAALQPKPAPRPVAAKPKPKPGKFRLQVAAVRSEAKAQQVVAQLRSKYASALAGAAPQIDAAAIGNMGTFYRVRVGPYADTTTPRGLCTQLKSDGYDCLIVTP